MPCGDTKKLFDVKGKVLSERSIAEVDRFTRRVYEVRSDGVEFVDVN